MEDPMRESYSKMQAESFKSIVEKIRAKGIPILSHASASSGILFSKNFHFDLARAGIALYGLWPSREIKLWAKDIKLVPALSWKTIVTEVKLVPKGAKVGYDLTHETLRNSRLAIIPVGYWHGLPRNLSNKGEVLLNGKRVPIVGRISMDMSIIDVTDIPNARPGDEVIIIGTQGKESITAEEVALKAGTINYEIVTRINPLIPRIILSDAKKNK
jgi:alanine racemase